MADDCRDSCEGLRREIESPGITLERLTQIVDLAGQMQNLWAEYRIRNERAAGRLLSEMRRAKN